MIAHLVPMIILSVIAIACSVVLLGQTGKDQRVAERLEAIRYGDQAIGGREDAAETLPFVARLLTRLGSAVAKSGFLPAKTMTELEHTLLTAGFKGRNTLALFIGCKFICLFVGAFLGWFGLGYLGFSGGTHIAGTIGGVVLGLLSPDWTVKFLRRRHINQLERGLPDALDMMVICAEAGLALEPAITRVGREIEPAHPAVSLEFLQTASELRIVADHRLALNQMAARTGLVGLKRLTTTLVQTMQYGTPLTDALRVLSTEMRGEMLTRFEARAARLPVLLTIPMIVFILPCVFLIVGGPAIIQVIHVFKG